MQSILRGTLTLVAAALLAPGPVRAQAQLEGALRMFLDCTGVFCDLDYYRREIDFVNYVRDRQDADVHVLVSTRTTGSGGREYDVRFIGLGDFADVEGNLLYASSATDTEDERRSGLSRTIKFGLMEFVASSGVADQIEINFQPSQVGPRPTVTAAEDSWNFWVFTISSNAFLNGESRQRFLNLNGSLNANRTTEDWKLNLRVNGNFNESRFELADGSEVVSSTESYGANGLLVRSVGPHWGAGVRSSLMSATFSNTSLRFQFTPAIEFNVFPYAESSRRQLTIQYGIGINAVDYTEETIFDQTAETLAEHSLTVSLAFTQPWGNTSFSVRGSQFLNDFGKNQLVLSGGGSLRLVRGLSFRLAGNISRVRNQLFLPKGEATDEEVLLRRRQLETNYRYFASFGLSYRFGSIFNNVVNPRFGGGRGEFFFF